LACNSTIDAVLSACMPASLLSFQNLQTIVPVSTVGLNGLASLNQASPTEIRRAIIMPFGLLTVNISAIQWVQH